MKVIFNPNGSVQVSNADEGKQNSDKTPAQDSWTLPPHELENHLRGLGNPKKAPKGEDHPWSDLSAGDKSAARDAAAQHADLVRENQKNS